MKPLLLHLISAAFVGLVPAVAQEAAEPTPIQAAGFETPAPETLPTTARIVGVVPDGSPPPRQAPKPQFIVPQRDVLKSTVHEQGGRTITLREIQPIDLPPPVPVEASAEVRADFSQRMANYRAAHPTVELIAVGATVYRSEGGAPRSQCTIWQRTPNSSDNEPITFWSSADFALLSGVSTFIGNDGKTRHFMLGWGTQDTDKLASLMARHGRTYVPPQPPALPSSPATFAVSSGTPTAETLTAIQSLHDLFNRENARLRTAFEGREKAREEQEAYLKAHPPQPKDITLNYWRTEKPATAGKGAAR